MSIWILDPNSIINGLHSIKFIHYMEKLLLNMNPSEPLAMMKKLPCFDNPIDLDGILTSVLCLGFHDPIKCHLFDAVIIELCRVQILNNV